MAAAHWTVQTRLFNAGMLKFTADSRQWSGASGALQHAPVSAVMPAARLSTRRRDTPAACAQHWAASLQRRLQVRGRIQRGTCVCSAKPGQALADAPKANTAPAPVRVLDSGGRVVELPSGAEANNAVALRRRRERQKEAAAGTAAAVEAAAPATRAADSATGEADAAAAAPAAVPGSVLGTVALLTGSTVGAGILALPLVSAPAGFGPSTGGRQTCHTV